MHDPTYVGPSTYLLPLKPTKPINTKRPNAIVTTCEYCKDFGIIHLNKFIML
jgi:hypothetical protein